MLVPGCRIPAVPRGVFSGQGNPFSTLAPPLLHSPFSQPSEHVRCEDSEARAECGGDTEDVRGIHKRRERVEKGQNMRDPLRPQEGVPTVTSARCQQMESQEEGAEAWLPEVPVRARGLVEPAQGAEHSG